MGRKRNHAMDITENGLIEKLNKLPPEMKGIGNH